ncbi:MAG TPA: tRNA dihydrouridine(20/20a) synthase DusA [Alphaproteobacteria bacterium]|nr:tRNA dihydrouridine(20/20a) synthase DusA [Alphaproteobacteria bacterium]
MLGNLSHKLCVAPMMDWTDRHCRAFHRHLTRRARLYTEMVTADAVIHGHRERLIGFEEIEHPLALQLGGSEARKLAEAARIGAERGYDEINLNVGCPSDRVQSGRFGACLMSEPALVADCLAAMRAASKALVTVKCRIGIDEQDPQETLPRFIESVASVGIDTVIIHARKAWLRGLSPEENRELPPLNYQLVYAMKRAFPHLTIVINGGVRSLEEAKAHLAHVDGVMLGRAAYQNPWILLDADREIFGEPSMQTSREAVLAMLPYIERQLDAGTLLIAITRHMLGLYHGVPGARLWRRTLSEDARRHGSGVDLITRALACVEAPQLSRQGFGELAHA